MKDGDADKGCTGFTMALEAYAKALAKPMRLRRWRELHALYIATEPDIGPRKKRVVRHPRRR